MLNTTPETRSESRNIIPNIQRTRSKSRTRWKKVRQTRERDINRIDEENEEDVLSDAEKLFERVITVEMKIGCIRDKSSSKLFNLTELVRNIPKKEKSDNQNVQGIVSKVKKNPDILNYGNTIFNLNWREKREVPGYYGCGDCSLCRASIFGDKFKVQNTGHWYKIKDSLDCKSSNVLYLATCIMCSHNVQYGSYATDMRMRMIQHREETKNLASMRDPAGNELSLHFFNVHGGWYENGVKFQVVKLIKQEEFPDITKALEAKEKSMKMQLDLFTPRGLNLRKEDLLARRMSQTIGPMTFMSRKMLQPPEPEKDSSVIKSRWSRLDYFRLKPTKLEELTDVARMLLKVKREEDLKSKSD